MDKNLENQLNELMAKNPRKFADLIEKTANNFKEKFNKEIYIKGQDKMHILDGSDPSDHSISLQKVDNWIEKSIDDVRNFIKPFSYPLFVYLYLDLIRGDHWTEGTSKDQVYIFVNLALLSKIGTTENIDGVEKFVLLNLTGEELDRINGKTSIIYSKLRKDQEIPNKRGRGRGDKQGVSRAIIPLPENYLEYLPIETPNLKIDKTNLPTIGCFTILNTHNKLNCADVTQDGSVIVCGFKDGTITVWVINPETKIEIDENTIRQLEEYRETNLPKIISKKSEIQNEENKKNEIFLKVDQDGQEQLYSAYEDCVKKFRKFKLYGHSDSVYSVSISPDKKHIVSGSYDENIRLWSIFTKSTLVVFKGHFSPVLSVKFSPFSHYFASGGCDRTARLWAMNSPGPLRIFVGHLSDVEQVDFHPNSLYIVTSANDKTIRLWALETGECVRIFFNYSSKTYTDCISFSGSGKIMAVACDRSLILYDLVKMGDPIRIVENFTQKAITALSFDNEDGVIAVTTDDYKILFFNLQSILNDDLSLKVDRECEMNKIELISQYTTKKTTILVMKFTLNNILLTLGRFDDNDPKIFM